MYMYTWYNLSFPLPVSKGTDTFPNRPIRIPVRIAPLAPGRGLMSCPISVARKTTLIELLLNSNLWGTGKWPLRNTWAQERTRRGRETSLR